jgi:hypothetical protein
LLTEKVILQHDSVCPHIAQILESHYPSNIQPEPNYFHLFFRRLKKHFEGKHFWCEDEMEARTCWWVQNSQVSGSQTFGFLMQPAIISNVVVLPAITACCLHSCGCHLEVRWICDLITVYPESFIHQVAVIYKDSHARTKLKTCFDFILGFCRSPPPPMQLTCPIPHTWQITRNFL